jgi:GrpB-like predicted nucleotidyltransferase (UPF0157 family)
MQVIIEPYNAEWPDVFLAGKTVIAIAIQHCSPTVEHFGSTSIPGLNAKPTIDILVGLNRQEDLDKTIKPMIEAGYTYIKKYEPLWPTRRFFMQLQSSTSIPPQVIDTNNNSVIGRDFISLANIHIIVKDSPDWTRMIAFRDFLRTHALIRNEYGELKEQLSKREYSDMNEYNDAKNSYVKQLEKNALEWFYQQATQAATNRVASPATSR